MPENSPKRAARAKKTPRLDLGLTPKEKAALEGIERWHKARAELEAVGRESVAARARAEA